MSNSPQARDHAPPCSSGATGCEKILLFSPRLGPRLHGLRQTREFSPISRRPYQGSHPPSATFGFSLAC